MRVYERPTMHFRGREEQNPHTPGERMRGQKMEEERRGDMRKQANCHLSLKQIFRPAADTV